MPRYFIEVAYKGSRYSGFQIQETGITIQSELERAFATVQRESVRFTGSSRTDAGVHALQNYFHLDFEAELQAHLIYKLNSIVGKDISVRRMYLMRPEAHCRFDATSREYMYRLHWNKNPFLQDVSLYFPYPVDLKLMQEAAQFIKSQHNFEGFAKTNSQVKNFSCTIDRCEWSVQGDEMIFHIRANRFLRGMVRLIVATMLKVGMKKMELETFKKLFTRDGRTVYSVPGYGLFLCKVNFPENYFSVPELNLQ